MEGAPENWELRKATRTNNPERLMSEEEQRNAAESLDVLRDGVSKETLAEMNDNTALVERVRQAMRRDDVVNSRGACEQIVLDYPEYGVGDIAALAEALQREEPQ